MAVMVNKYMIKILSTSDVPLPCPSGKQPVLFYGTNETAFLKPADMYAYEQYRQKNEVPRKLKGFNQAVVEIRREAGKFWLKRF